MNALHLSKYGRCVTSGLGITVIVGLVGGASLLVRAESHDHGAEHQTKGHAGHGGGVGQHRHARWVKPPKEYAAKRSTRWADLEAIARGKRLYEGDCMTCHGADGKGTGPSAASLAHAPADLTHHFHRAPGSGDAYLFWRISEGGSVQPFSSMQSAMPAFKTTLTENQRWDVLAYVHAFFHLGLINWQPDGR